METAPAVLELGLVLLAAAGLGVAARHVGLPAVVGYLALGIAVSPFTPGFVANREQIQLLADVGVVLLLFEVGIEVDLGSLRKEHGGLIWAAPLQVVLTTGIAGAAAVLAGVALVPAAVLGLCVALSSSVVIVNITRSRNRTTDPPTEQALLGWSVIQDLTGVILAAVLLVALGSNDRPAAVMIGGFIAFFVLAVGDGLAAAEDPRPPERPPGLVPDRGGRLRPGDRRRGGRGVRAADRPGRVRRRTRDCGEPDDRRAAPPAHPVSGAPGGPVLRHDRDAARPARPRLPGCPGWHSSWACSSSPKSESPGSWAGLRCPGARPLQLAVGLGQMGEFSFVLATFLVAADAINGAIYAALVASVAISIGLSAVLVRVPRLAVSRAS